MKNENELISSIEAAKLLGIKRSTLYQWTSERKIPFIKISRNHIKFDSEALQAWIEARKVEALSGGGHRRGTKAGGRKPSDEAYGGARAKSAREEPKKRALSKERNASLRKVMGLRAREHLKEKEKRLKRARRKAAAEAIGKRDSDG